MSHKVMIFDVSASRKSEYEKMEVSGESQQAIWDVIQTLQDNGIDIGEKAATILTLRNQIKQRNL